MASVISKSVGRVFDVLELFREQRRPMSAADIQRRLQIPQPSIRALLKNLVELGYLDYERSTRKYFPALHLARLGDWIEQSLLGGGELAALVESVSMATGETVSLSTDSDI